MNLETQRPPKFWYTSNLPHRRRAIYVRGVFAVPAQPGYLRGTGGRGRSSPGSCGPGPRLSSGLSPLGNPIPASGRYSTNFGNINRRGLSESSARSWERAGSVHFNLFFPVEVGAPGLHNNTSLEISHAIRTIFFLAALLSLL